MDTSVKLALYGQLVPLVAELRIEAGHYFGQVNRLSVPDGHGVLRVASGDHVFGQWDRGRLVRVTERWPAAGRSVVPMHNTRIGSVQAHRLPYGDCSFVLVRRRGVGIERGRVAQIKIMLGTKCAYVHNRIEACGQVVHCALEHGSPVKCADAFRATTGTIRVKAVIEGVDYDMGSYLLADVNATRARLIRVSLP